MGLNFPATPLVGDLYPTPALPGVPQYRWTGAVWVTNWIGGSMPEPPNDAAMYGRAQTGGVGAWARSVALLGDTMTGPLLLNGNPSNALGAASKQYVDALVALYVNKTGDTMSGSLTFSAGNAVLSAGSVLNNTRSDVAPHLDTTSAPGYAVAAGNNVSAPLNGVPGCYFLLIVETLVTGAPGLYLAGGGTIPIFIGGGAGWFAPSATTPVPTSGQSTVGFDAGVGKYRVYHNQTNARNYRVMMLKF